MQLMTDGKLRAKFGSFSNYCSQIAADLKIDKGTLYKAMKVLIEMVTSCKMFSTETDLFHPTKGR